MYLRLRKRKKPLPTDNPNAPAHQPVAGAADPPPTTASEWVPAEPAEGEPDAGTDVSVSRHPNRGKAQESARGSHR